jgi:integrase
LSVSKKPGFDIKNYEERTIPIFDELVVLLKRHRSRQRPGMRLIFPTSKHNVKRGAPGGQADGHILRKLKRLAFRSGLNCGHCTGMLNKKPASCAKAPICRKFNLHMFRHTYATQMLRDGVDLLSLQKLLGHKDLDSTREYLRALEPDDLRKKVLTTSLATRFV